MGMRYVNKLSVFEYARFQICLLVMWYPHCDVAPCWQLPVPGQKKKKENTSNLYRDLQCLTSCWMPLMASKLSIEWYMT